MSQINEWRESLKIVLIELGDCDPTEMVELDKKLEWTAKENPELELPNLEGKNGRFLLEKNRIVQMGYLEYKTKL